MKKSIAILIGAGVAFIGGTVAAQDMWFSDSRATLSLTRDGVQTLKNGWLMLPPEPVVSDVVSTSWSPSGAHLLVAARSLKPEVDAALSDLSLTTKPEVPAPIRLGVVNPKNLQTRWVGEISGHTLYLSEYWVKGTEIVQIVAAQAEDRYENRTIHVGTGKILNLFPNDMDVEFTSLGKGCALGIATSRTNAAPIMKVIGSNGAALPLPAGLENALKEWGFAGWSDKYGIMLLKDRQAAVLLDSGRVQPIDFEEMRKEWIKSAEVEDASKAELIANLRGAEPRREAWLHAFPDVGPQPAALIATGVTSADVAPGLSCVTFLQNRMLWVRRLVKVDLEAYAIARRIAIKSDAMNKAKQVGLALIIYGADYDDLLPDSNFEEVVMPYIKNREMLGGFTFTLSGGDLSKVEPDTEIGYVETPEGRASVRADGSVIWKPK